jgi:predicted HicB family RNase H-like nuclease
MPPHKKKPSRQAHRLEESTTAAGEHEGTAEEKATAKDVLTIRLPADLHRQIRLVAADEGRSINQIITSALRDWWDRRPDRRVWEEFMQRKPAGGSETNTR